jgi:DNA-binding response OmpR family regulator
MPAHLRRPAFRTRIIRGNAVRGSTRTHAMSPAHLLIVEDDPFAAALLRAQLEDMGYRVTHALTAAEGLDLAFSERPDLIVMDVGLGAGIDGITAAGAIRRAMDTPIVLLTMRTDTTTMTRAELIEGAAYLQKSCSQEELQFTIESALEEAARAARRGHAARPRLQADY